MGDSYSDAESKPLLQQTEPQEDLKIDKAGLKKAGLNEAGDTSKNEFKASDCSKDAHGFDTPRTAVDTDHESGSTERDSGDSAGTTDSSTEGKQDAKAPGSTDYEELIAQLYLALPLMYTVGMSDAICAAVDNVFLGHISAEALAAATMGAAPMMIALGMCTAVNEYGVLILAGQASGAGKKKMASVWLARACVIQAVASLLMFASAYFASDYCKLAGANETVASMCGTFAWWRLPGLVFYVGFTAIRCYVQTVEQDLMPAVIATTVVVVLNVPLNYIFISLFGFSGSPMATSTAETLSVLGFVFFLRRYRPQAYTGMLSGFVPALVFKTDGLWTMLMATLPGMINNGFGCTMIAVLNAVLYSILPSPTASMAAFGLVCSVTSVFGAFSSSILGTVATRVSNAIAYSEDYEQNKVWCLRALRCGVFLVNVVLIPATLLFALGGDSILHLFSSDERVLAIANDSFSPLMIGFTISGTTGILAVFLTSLSYFVTSSVVELSNGILIIGTMVLVLVYVHRSLPAALWAYACTAALSLPILLVLVSLADYEDCTKTAREKALEAEDDNDEKELQKKQESLV